MQTGTSDTQMTPHTDGQTARSNRHGNVLPVLLSAGPRSLVPDCHMLKAREKEPNTSYLVIRDRVR